MATTEATNKLLAVEQVSSAASEAGAGAALYVHIHRWDPYANEFWCAPGLTGHHGGVAVTIRRCGTWSDYGQRVTLPTRDAAMRWAVSVWAELARVGCGQ